MIFHHPISSSFLFLIPVIIYKKSRTFSSQLFTCLKYMKEIVNCVAYADGKRSAEVELNKVHEVLKDANQFVWIGLHEPSEEILQIVQEEFHLHDLAIEDAHRAHQRPKIEVYGDSLFIVLRTAQMTPQCRIEFGETHFFVGKNFIVSVRHGPSVPYTEVRSRCEAMPELLCKGHGFVLYAIMDFIVDRYFPVVDDMEKELETIENGSGFSDTQGYSYTLDSCEIVIAGTGIVITKQLNHKQVQSILDQVEELETV